jgi:hypothetical protein
MDVIYGVKLEDRHNLTIKKAMLVKELLDVLDVIVDIQNIINKYLFEVSDNFTGFKVIEEDKLLTSNKYYGITYASLYNRHRISHKSITPVKINVPPSIILHSMCVFEKPKLFFTYFNWSYTSYVIYGARLSYKDDDRIDEVSTMLNNDEKIVYIDDENEFSYIGFIVEIISNEDDKETQFRKLTKQYKAEYYYHLSAQLDVLLKKYNLTTYCLPFLILFNE